MSAFQKATKKKSKLRAALFGPSGSGKTFTGLSIATGIGGKIAVIDTERGSASKYSDRFDFDVCDLENKTIDGYCKAIVQARGYEVLMIDSLSHGWQELLEHVEKLAQAKYRGNTWSAWSEGTPEQRRLIDAILDFPGHVIATMRSKTEWTTAKQENGKSAPVRVGLAPEQGKGIEYEFDLLLELTVDHVCNVLKDRTGKFQDALIDKPGEDFGKSLVDWLNEGEEPKAPEPAKPVISEDEAKLGNIAKLRKVIASATPEGMDAANIEQMFCEKAAAFVADNKTERATLEAFTLDELREMFPKRNTIIGLVMDAAKGVTK